MLRIALVPQFCSWSACRMNRHVERVLEHTIRFVLQLGHLEHHVEEVAGVAQIVVGIVVRHPDAVPIRERGKRRHLGYQPVDLMAGATAGLKMSLASL